MSLGKMLLLIIIGFIALMVIRSVGLPDMPSMPELDWITYFVPAILIIVGAAFVYKKVGGGWILVFLGLIIIWLGQDNLAEIGRNIGQGAQELSLGLNESGSLPTTGKIAPSRTFGDPQVFALSDTWRRADQPPGTELCADPITEIEMRQDSTPAVKYFRSLRRGNVVHVHFYFMPYGHDCVLSTPRPDGNARSGTQLNRQAHESERGGFSFV